jgi:hypothetical protein
LFTWFLYLQKFYSARTQFLLEKLLHTYKPFALYLESSRDRDTSDNSPRHLHFTYTHKITPVSLWSMQVSLTFTCYDPYTHLSLLPLSSNSSYTLAAFRYSWSGPFLKLPQFSQRFCQSPFIHPSYMTHILPKWFSYEKYYRRDR